MRMYSRRIMEILYGAKKRVHAFGYNSAESEPIWVKSRTVWAKCWGLDLADFGCDPRSSDGLRGSRNCFFFCQVNNARFHRFPVRQILQRRSARRWKLLEQNLKNFAIRGPKTQKVLTRVPSLATSGHHDSAMITDTENSLPNDPPTGCLCFHVYR